MGEFHWDVAAASTLAALSGIAAAWWLYLAAPQALGRLTAAMRSAGLYQLSFGKFFVDELYDAMFHAF